MPTIFQTFDRHGEPHRNWRFKYIDYTGKRKTATGLPSKTATKALAWKIQAEQDEIRKGLRPPPKESDRPRRFEDIVTEYLAWGISQGGHGGRPWGEIHVRNRRSHLKFWQVRLKLEFLSDVLGVLSKVEALLRELQAAGRTGKTLQNYAEALAALCDWAIKRGYLESHPLKNLHEFDTDPQTVRRALTIDEVNRLLAVASPARRLLYEIALASGLRANELRSLRLRHVDADASGLRLEAGWTKGRRANFQPLHPVLVRKLIESGNGKDPTAPLLKVPANTSSPMNRDLAAAGIPKVTVEGKVDFHALRTAYTTFAFEAGATIKEAQSLARHSTPDLTLNVYARSRSDRLSGIATSIGDRFIGPAACTTGVQQFQDRSQPFNANEGSKTSSNENPGSNAAGSNPPAASNCGAATVGQPDVNLGLSSTQVGHADHVGHSPLVETRTTPDTAADGFGQRECTTSVQRILAASGVFGFSIDAAAVRKNFSGFSSANMRSA